mgnify:CR=1 FL=1
MEFRKRIIPVLLVKGNSLVKTINFKNENYIGDPVNTVKIFNEKEVDELMVLDIGASRGEYKINFELVEEMASEAFMPVSYGGAIKTVQEIKRVIRSGIEKVVINSSNYSNLDLIKDASEFFGSQAIIGGIDVYKNFFRKYSLAYESGRKKVKKDIMTHISDLVKFGIGELLVNSIERDGTMSGFDIDLLQKISGQFNIPVIACGGAGSIAHLDEALSMGGASAVAAGSLFVYYGRHKAVLINYPTAKE